MPKADWPSMCSFINCRIGSSALTSYLWERNRKTGKEQEWQCNTDSSCPAQSKGRKDPADGRKRRELEKG